MKWHIYKIDGFWQVWHDSGYNGGGWITFDFALMWVTRIAGPMMSNLGRAPYDLA